MIKMRRSLYIIIFSFLLLIPLNVKASSNTISISCPEKANSNSTISCSLVGYSDGYISSLSTKINLSSNLELISFTTNPIWSGGINSNNQIDVYTDNNKTGQFNIGTLNIKVGSNANSTQNESTLVINNTFYDDNFDGMNVSNTSSTIKITSTDNYLYSLSVSGYSLNPSFNANQQEYNIEVNTESITIYAIASDTKATVTGTGQKNLNVGLNSFVIGVKSEAGETRNYTINITRVATNYSNNTNNNTNNTNNNNTQKNNMNPNANNKPLSDNNNLKTLEIKDYKIDFKPDVLEYNIEVESNVENIEVNATAEDDNAKIQIDGNKDLVYGKNVVVIQVNSESNQLKEYKIIVNRKANNNCLLKTLSINGYDIDFDNKTFVYNVSITDEDKLDITAISEDKNAKVKILNNENLVNGSVITISVDNDNDNAEYKIYIKKDGGQIETTGTNKKSNNFLIFIIITIILIGIIVGAIIFIKKRKNNKPHNDNSNNTLSDNNNQTITNAIDNTNTMNNQPIDNTQTITPINIQNITPVNDEINNNEFVENNQNIPINNIESNNVIPDNNNSLNQNISQPDIPVVNQEINQSNNQPINLNNIINNEENK